jgi:hypothetical protein
MQKLDVRVVTSGYSLSQGEYFGSGCRIGLLMTDHVFRLFWPRETGMDRGTAIGANELAPEVRNRILALAGNEPGEFVLRLPYLDRKQCRKQGDILRGLTLVREGSVIRAVLPPQAAARDLAASSVLTDPLWRSGPSERQPAYFHTWQGVSLALQRWLRDQVAQAYFADAARFEDRPAAYPVIVYQASRLCHGHPRTEFTYDLRDYPECDTTLAASWKMTGRTIQAVLQRIESRLLAAGRMELAHRYAPVWHRDVLVAVQKRPRPYVELLMMEAAVINAVIDLGTERSLEAAKRFAAVVNLNLRNARGIDLRELGTGVLAEATRVLAIAGSEKRSRGGDNLLDGGMLQDLHAGAAGSPDAGIAGQEDGDHGKAHGGCQVRNAGIVADVNARAGEPAGQFV